jgi:E3 ubiquitin-protein ligase makorin
MYVEKQKRNADHTDRRACPECRQTSDYICPSRYWVDTKEEKEKLLSSYKEALNKKECKYFKRGEVHIVI